MQHRVWAEINLKKMAENCQFLEKNVGGPNRLLMVLKANAYGHGTHCALEVAKNTKIKRIGVGDSHEALECRELGWKDEILILGSLIEDEIISVMQNEISVVVHSLEKVTFLNKISKSFKKPLRVHLKVDTGMRRFGTGPEKASEIAAVLQQSEFLHWTGLMTHFAHSPQHPSTEHQLKCFQEVIATLSPLPKQVKIHAANTRMALDIKKSHYDFIRSGLGIYGMMDHPKLSPCLSLYSQIIFIKDIPAGSYVGYEGEHHCSQPTRIGIIPMGYSDGFRLAFSNKGHVLIRGKKAPVIGRVSMDYATVDISNISETKVGEKVILIGKDSNEMITLEDWAQWAQTTLYEITTLLGNRVRRVSVQ